MEQKLDVQILPVEVNKISLQPGDVLLVKFRGPEVMDPALMESFRKQFGQFFPDNRVFVVAMDTSYDMILDIVRKDEQNATHT